MIGYIYKKIPKTRQSNRKTRIVIKNNYGIAQPELELIKNQV